ncbi:MAG: efflux RND transporter periplasmic adaptor subunit [Alphaproteobacteria bacterium]|nr:efflux RND transporter periplasmic adaptor subunit [Alphaproteobacteria bacterium]
MIKRMIIMLLAVMIVVGGLIGFKMFIAKMTGKQLANKTEQAQTVSTMTVKTDEWRVTLSSVGSVRAINGTNVSAEVSGIIEQVLFESGMTVEAGKPLVKLRDRDDVAQLRALEASYNLAQISFERAGKQIASKAISQAAYDSAKANHDTLREQVVQQKALIAKKNITAPFRGTLGIRNVDLGQFLSVGTVMVTLQQLDPIYIDFELPEQEGFSAAVGQDVAVSIDGLQDTVFKGKVTAIDSQINENSRSVQVRAMVDNPGHKLLPGMFARVSVDLGTPTQYLTLPRTAVTFNPFGDMVFLVAKDHKGQLIAKQTFVRLGPSRGDQVSVISGIKEGDEIVTSGQLKLRNGTPVVVNNDVQPLNDPNPSIVDE